MEEIANYFGSASLARRTQRGVAQARSCADIQAAKILAVTDATQLGLQSIAFISQVEQQLGQAVPIAVTRLQGIGDIGALSLAQVVMDTANALKGFEMPWYLWMAAGAVAAIAALFLYAWVMNAADDRSRQQQQAQYSRQRAAEQDMQKIVQSTISEMFKSMRGML